MHVSGSPKLSGTIPTELLQLTRLWELTINHAPNLSGTLPVGLDSWKEARSLLALQVAGTRLSGTLPRTLPGPCRWPFANGALAAGTLYNAHQCHYRSRLELCCKLSGTLPRGLQFGAGVASLDLHGNRRLSGTLPSALSTYHRVDLRGSRLSGSVPAELVNSHALWSLRLPLPLVGWRESLLARQPQQQQQQQSQQQQLRKQSPHQSPSDEVEQAEATATAASLLFGQSKPATPKATQRILSNWLSRLEAESFAAVAGPTTATSSADAAASSGSANAAHAVVADSTSETPRGPAATASPTTCCIHGCHGRGACVSGRCVCKPPWAGLDCGVAVEASAPRADDPAVAPSSAHTASCDLRACPGGERRGIYIGSRGHEITAATPSLRVPKHEHEMACVAVPLATFSPHGISIYAAPDMLLLRLLADGIGHGPGGKLELQVHRAHSACCALARWDPLFMFRIIGNVGNIDLKWQLQAAVAAKRLAADAAAWASSGRWALTETRRLPQIWEEHMDRGECNVPAGVMRAGDLVLTHWGDERCFGAGVHHIVLPPGSAGSSGLGANSTAAGTRWRVTDHRLTSAARRTYADASALHKPGRQRALFFRGAVREKRSARDQKCYVPRAPTPACRRTYSMGIRQIAKRYLGEHPFVHFNRDALSAGAGYHDLLRTYEFCLCAPGKGFGNRIVDYVAAGCIPVLLRPGALRMPLEPELDYDGFAVSVPLKAIRSLPALLANMSEAAIRRKRERLREVHRDFLWDEAYGTAFEAVFERVVRLLSVSTAGSV